MRTKWYILIALLSSCATVQRSPAVKVEQEPPAVQEITEVEVEVEPESEPEEESEENDEPEESVTESVDSQEPQYTGDITDEMLAHMLVDSPQSLGSLSMGIVNNGKLINGVRFPDGEFWKVVQPEKAYGTIETVQYLLLAIQKFYQKYPDASPLRINHISNPHGGYMRPHKSHQNGRDVDLGFFYSGKPVKTRQYEKYIDVKKNWHLIKSIIIETDVQFILVDKRIIKKLKKYALDSGEEPEWVSSIFDSEEPLVRHAKRHRDHFHVRFYNPRAQELARRVSHFTASKIAGIDSVLAKYCNSERVVLKRGKNRHARHQKKEKTYSVNVCVFNPVSFVLPPRRFPAIKTTQYLSPHKKRGKHTPFTAIFKL